MVGGMTASPPQFQLPANGIYDLTDNFASESLRSAHDRRLNVGYCPIAFASLTWRL